MNRLLAASGLGLAAAIAATQLARPQELCVDGHPAKRSAHVTYGDAPPLYGRVRDHIVPLGLGGPDTAANIQYQTPAEAQAKDKVEWRAIEGYCAGQLSLKAALSMVAHWRQ